MNIALDKYLTAAPEDHFQQYAENVCDRLSKAAISHDQQTDFTCSDQFNNFLETLFNAGILEEDAVKIANSLFDNYIQPEQNGADPCDDAREYSDAVQWGEQPTPYE